MSVIKWLIKNKGSIILEQAHNIRTLNVICVLPTTETITQNLIPADVIERPISLSFNNDIGMCDDPDLEWYSDVVSIVKSMEDKKRLILDKLDLEYVQILIKDVKVLSDIIVSRVPRFVEFHIPRNQSKLYSGVHWVWDSLKYLLPKLCAVIILSGHIIDSKE